ncbi:MAG3090 family protein [Mycoplasmopsis cricetuli]|uniref:MAG3090 family protein n=1 Tax=Mycoplasmopsis cricetuli TaxID=171283 RepID=UPI000470A05C|nr:hypothetical protein [Mycoplasmopsis cricetuli]
MKRLQCLYKPNNNRDYPWALKHPKVSQPLALFKTRKDAMNWFLSKDLECATWFQTEEKIWGGLLLAERVGEDFEFELNVDKFDGGLNYENIADELNIFPTTGLRDKRRAGQYVRYLTDFKPVYKNMENIEPYFPKDDDFIAPKKSKKDLEIESLKEQISKLLLEISRSGDQYKHEIDDLMERLNDEKSDKSQLLAEINALREKSQEQIKQPEVEKVIIKEIIKEVPVEKIVYKESKHARKRYIKFAYIDTLDLATQAEVTALYAHKLQLINDQILDGTKISEEEFNKVKENYVPVIRYILDLEERMESQSRYTKLLYKTAADIINREIDILLDKVSLDERKEFTTESAIYVTDIDQKTVISLDQALSFVEYKDKYVAFVPEQNYKHAILLHESYEHAKELVLLESFKEIEVVKTQIKEVSTENATPSEFVKKLKLALILFGIAWLIAVIIIIILAISASA